MATLPKDSLRESLKKRLESLDQRDEFLRKKEESLDQVSVASVASNRMRRPTKD